MADRTNLNEFDWANDAPPASDVQPEVAADPAVAAPAAPQPDPIAPTRRGRPQLELDESLLPEYARQIGHKNRFKRPVSTKTNLNEYDWTGEGVQEPGTGGAYKDDEDWAPLQGFKTGWNTSRDSIYHVADMAEIMALPADQQVQAMIEFGNKPDDPSQAHMTFDDPTQIGSKDGYISDAFTFVTENVTQTLGSWGAAAAFGGGTGAVVGGAGGAAVGSVAPGIGTAAGAVGGALGGFTYGTMGAFGAMGVGGMYKDLLSDKGVQDALKAGTLTPTEVNTVATLAGGVIGAIDAIPGGKIANQVFGKTGGAKLYKETVKRAVLQGIKSGAIKEGGTEALQGAISELGQAIEGGNWDAAERTFSVLNQGLSGAIGGAGPGALGEVGENKRRLDQPNQNAAPLPGVIGPTQPLPSGPAPAPGTSGPGAQPGGIAPGVGPGTNSPGGLGTSVQPPLGAKTGQPAQQPNYGKGQPAGGGPSGKVTVNPNGAIPDDIGSALADDEDVEVGSGEFAPEGVAVDPAAAAGKPAPPPTAKPAAASNGVDAGIQAALGSEAGYKPGIGGEPAPAHSDVITGLPDYGAPRPAPTVDPIVQPEPVVAPTVDPVVTPEPPAVTPEVTPTPEPPSDTLAQLAAVRDPSSAKDAALITPDSPRDGLDLKGLYRVETPQGLFVTRNRKKAAAVRTAGGLTEEELAELLGYAAPLSESDGTVVQGRDAAGNVVHEEATNVADAGLAAENAAAAVPGGDVVETDAIAAQDQRSLGPAEQAITTAKRRGRVKHDPNAGPKESTYPQGEPYGEPAPAFSDVTKGLPDYGGPEYEDTDEEAAVKRQQRAEDFAGSINEDFDELNRAHFLMKAWTDSNKTFKPDEPPTFRPVAELEAEGRAQTKAAIKKVGEVRAERDAEREKWKRQKKEYDELRAAVAKASSYTRTALDDIRTRLEALSPEDAEALLDTLEAHVHEAIEQDRRRRVRRKPPGENTTPVESDLSEQHSNQPERKQRAPAPSPARLEVPAAAKVAENKKGKEVTQRITALTADADRLKDIKAEVADKNGTVLGHVTGVETHAPDRTVKIKAKKLRKPAPITIGDQTFETVADFNAAIKELDDRLDPLRKEVAAIHAAVREIATRSKAIAPDSIKDKNVDKWKKRNAARIKELKAQYPKPAAQLKALDTAITAIGDRMRPFHAVVRDGKQLAAMRVYEAAVKEGDKTHVIKGEQYPEKRVKVSFLAKSVADKVMTLAELFKKYVVQSPRTKDTLPDKDIRAPIPQSERQRAIAAMRKHFFKKGAAAVELDSLKFEPEEIAALERAGVAAHGHMTRDEFLRWQRSMQGAPVEKVATPRSVAAAPAPAYTRRKTGLKNPLTAIKTGRRRYTAKGTPIAGEVVPFDREPKRLNEREAAAKSIDERWEEGWAVWRGLPLPMAVEKALTEKLRYGTYRQGTEHETEAIREATQRAVGTATQFDLRRQELGLPPMDNARPNKSRRQLFEEGVLDALDKFDKGYIKREEMFAKLARDHDKAMDDAAAELRAEKASRERLSKNKGMTGADRIAGLNITQIGLQVVANGKKEKSLRDPLLTKMEKLYARRKPFQNKWMNKRTGVVNLTKKVQLDAIDAEIMEINDERVERAKAAAVALEAAEAQAQEQRDADVEANKKFLNRLVAEGKLEQDVANALASSSTMSQQYDAMQKRNAKSGPVLRGIVASAAPPIESVRDIPWQEQHEKTPRLREIRERTAERETLKQTYKRVLRAEGKNERTADKEAEAEVEKQIPKASIPKPFKRTKSRVEFRQHLGDLGEPTKAQAKRAAKSNMSVEQIMLEDKGATLFQKTSTWAKDFVKSVDRRLSAAGTSLPKKAHSVYNTPMENGLIYIKGLVGERVASEQYGTSRKGGASDAPRRVSEDTEKFLETDAGGKALPKRDKIVFDVSDIMVPKNATEEEIDAAKAAAAKLAETHAVASIKQGTIYEAATMVYFMREYAKAEKAGNLVEQDKWRRVIDGTVFQANKNQSTMGEKAVYSDSQIEADQQNMKDGLERDAAGQQGEDVAAEEAVDEEEVINSEAYRLAKAWRVDDRLVKPDLKQQKSMGQAIDELNKRDPSFSSKESPVTLPSPTGRRSTTPELSTTVRGAVYSFLDPRPKGLLGHIRRQLVRSMMHLIGDVPVHFVDGEFTNHKAGVYHPGVNPVILLNEQLLNRPKLLADTLVHEMVHAATSYAMHANIKGTRDIIEAMMREMKGQLGDLNQYAPTIRNAFKNADEFLATSYGDGEFQQLMMAHSPSIETRARIRALGKGRVMPSWWDTFVATVSAAVSFGNGKAANNYLNNVISIYPHVATNSREQNYGLQMEQRQRDIEGGVDSDFEPLESPVSIEGIRKIVDTISRSTFHHNVLITTEGIRRRAAKTFFDGKMDNPVSRLIDMLEQHVRLVSDKMKASDEALSKLRNWYMQDPINRKPLVARAHEVLHEGSLYHIDPRLSRAQQPHIWDDANHPLANGAVRATPTFNHDKHAGMREAADRLHTEYMALPQELRDLMSVNADLLNKAMVEHETGLIKGALNAMINKANGPVVLPAGMDEDAAAKEIYENRMSLPLIAALGKNYKTFKDYGRLGLRGGIYIPSFRKGRYFIAGRYNVATPAGAVRDTVAYDKKKVLRFVFSDRTKATDYVRDMGRTDDERVIGYATLYMDPATRGISKKATPTHTVPLYYVTVQNSFMDMSDDKKALQKQIMEMRGSGDFEHVSEPAELKEHRQLGGSMPLQLSTMLNNVDQMSGISDAQKLVLKEGMTHVFVQSQLGNRITKRMQHRKGVFGSKTGADEMIQSFRQTSEMMARHNVALTRMPKIREATKEIEALIAAFTNASTTGHSKITNLSPAMQALVSRNYAKDSDIGNKLAEELRVINDRLDKNMTASGRSQATETLLNSVMSAVTMTYLAGPSFLAINTASVPMFTFPRMAAEMARTHGYFKGWAMAAQYMWRNSGRVSWLQNYTKGVTEAMAEGAHMVGGLAPRANWMGEGRPMRTTYDSVEANKQRVLASGGPYAADMADVLEEARLDNFLGQAGLDQANLRDTMMEAKTTLGKAGLKAARGIEQSTRVFRALSDGIETNNRVIPLLSYYEYFRDSGMSHAEAKAKAINMMSSEQVGYAKENWSPWMAKGPVSAMLLFKKFPIQQAQNYYESLANAVGEDKDDRKVAIRQVANTTLMLGLVGGFAGNPLWEPFKYLYALLSKVFGWGDYDELKTEGEKLMEKWIGGMPAEMVMYGAPRALGIDISSRVGLDTTLMMSLPKDDKSETLAGTLGQIVGGAPFTAGMNTYHFLTDTTGDKTYSKWLSGSPAPKIVKDIFKAYDLYEHGPTTATGVSAGKGISLPEAIVQGFGIRPRSQSRPFEVGSVAKRRAVTRINEDRLSLMQRLNNQGITKDNARRLREWNRSHNVKGERITMRDFAKSRRRRAEVEAEIRSANRGN